MIMSRNCDFPTTWLLVAAMDRLVVDSEGDPGLQSWSTTFQFETDEKRLNSIREVKARLKPLEDKLDRFNAAHHVRVVCTLCAFVGVFVLLRSQLPTYFCSGITTIVCVGV